MTFVHDQDSLLLAGFRQNPLQNIKPGFKAEVIFTAAPGKVFQASVKGMSEIMGQGQLLPDGRLLRMDNVTGAGRVKTHRF